MEVWASSQPEMYLQLGDQSRSDIISSKQFCAKSHQGTKGRGSGSLTPNQCHTQQVVYLLLQANICCCSPFVKYAHEYIILNFCQPRTPGAHAEMALEQMCNSLVYT